jgi:zinc transport system ATP-binding protein
MENVIEVSGLCFGYDVNPVLKNINFSVEKGDFAGIIGPNGSGKSTLLKLLLKLMKPSAGGIRLFGREISDFKQWHKIGYIAQRNVFHSGFPASVYEVVSANLYEKTGLLHIPSKVQRQTVKKALETVGMEHAERELIGNLSGGQQQRVYLARVLVTEPEILLLDEPSSGMDTKSEASMYELLRRLNREERLTIVMVTHDVSAVTAYAGRLFCMGDEGLVEHDVREGLTSGFLTELYGRDVHMHAHSKA